MGKFEDLKLHISFLFFILHVLIWLCVKYQAYNPSKGIPILFFSFAHIQVLFFSSFEIESEENDTSNDLFDFFGENVHVEDGEIGLINKSLLQPIESTTKVLITKDGVVWGIHFPDWNTY